MKGVQKGCTGIETGAGAEALVQTTRTPAAVRQGGVADRRRQEAGNRSQHLSVGADRSRGDRAARIIRGDERTGVPPSPTPRQDRCGCRSSWQRRWTTEAQTGEADEFGTGAAPPSADTSNRQ